MTSTWPSIVVAMTCAVAPAGCVVTEKQFSTTLDKRLDETPTE